jgi:CDP-glucose 4,6-dehydratase
MGNFWKDKHVLITGANGFLGSHLSIELLKNGATVIGIIKVNPKKTFLNIELRKLKNSKISLIKSDVVKLGPVLRIFKEKKPDICIHLAAQPIVGIANKSPLPTLETNIRGTWNVLEAARINRTRAVIVASSDKAYGAHRILPYKEIAALLALHPYDASKACADMLARVYAHTYGLNSAVTRCCNIYGPGDFNFSRIIPDTIRSIILDKNPVVRSDGTPLRDYIYVDDAVNAYLVLAELLYKGKVKPGEAFNFGAGRPISVLSLVNKILTTSGKHYLNPEVLSKRKIKGEIDKQYLSSHKARMQLGWRCRHPLAQGLKSTLSWYLKHLK